MKTHTNIIQARLALTMVLFSICITTGLAKPEQVAAYPASVPKPTLSEVAYGTNQRHVLDFWKAESDQPTPLVFVIHGGGWRNGSKERLNRFVDAAALLKEGISVVAINYRYTKNNSELKPPVKAPLYDAARALQFVRNKAAEWNIDKTRIAAAGSSAGACSSLWLLYHDDLADPKSEDPIARESTRLYCAAVNNAQTTLDPQQMKEWTPNSNYGGHAFGINGFDQFLAERENILPWIAEFSPYALVSADDPPVYLYYKGAAPDIGKPQNDPTHTANFGLKLQEHCVKLGVKCELMYHGAPNVRYKNSTDYLIATLKSPAVTRATRTGLAKPYIPEEGSHELTKKHRKKSPLEMDPNLPKVLIIGDSISIGYTGHVCTQLKGKANVIHNPGNAAGTTLGFEKLQEWLGDTKWDVIHFNWGLHDLKHVTETGANSNNPDDPQQADLATYTANLKVLVKQLKATDAKLIFATTTPYPKGVKPCRLPEDAVKYNAAALKIMKTNNIEVNDLYSLALPKLKTLQRRRNVHFKPEGSEVLANQVAARIQSVLPAVRHGARPE